MAKKKKAAITRSYATTSIKKPDPIPLVTPPEPEPEAWEDSIPIEAIPEPIKDQHRLIKAQVESDYRSQYNQMIKLYKDESLPMIILSEAVERTLWEYLKNRFDTSMMIHTTYLIVTSSPKIVNEDVEKHCHRSFLLLEKMGFSRTDIKTSLLKSEGNLQKAIEWMCLNLTNEQLPAGFCDKFDSDHVIELSLHQCYDPKEREPAPKSNDAIPDITPMHPCKPKKEVEDISHDQDLRSKILASLEWLESDEDEESTEAQKDKALEQYVRISLELLRCKRQAAFAKKSGDEKMRKNASRSVGELSKSIKELLEQLSESELKEAEETISSKWQEEPELEMPALSTPTQKNGESDESEDDLAIGGMFDESAASTDGPTSRTVTILDLSYKTWSGTYPSTLLAEWIQKNMPLCKQSFSLMERSTTGYRARLKLVTQKQVQDFCMDDLEQTTTANDAKEYIALKALYSLSPQAQLQNRIPPPFRDVWKAWVSTTETEQGASQRALDEDREAFVQELLETVKGCKASPTVNQFSKIPSRSGGTYLSYQTTDVRTRSDQSLQNEFRSRKASTAYMKLFNTRSKLPIYAARETIISEINHNQVVVLAGETGSGKSTQIPQFILEDAFERGTGSSINLFCAQPRRISAISLASRVSLEMGDKVNGVGKEGSWVGYQVRMDNCTSKSTQLTFCTTGILLRRIVGDPDLKDISHVVVDEVHERSLESDFLLLLLKRLIQRRSDLTIILMSATADLERFQKYFAVESDRSPAILSIPGKTFPVKPFFLEDILDMIGKLSCRISQNADWIPDEKSSGLSDKHEKKITFSGRGGRKISMIAQWETDDFSASPKSSMETKMADLQLRNQKVNLDLLEKLIIYVVRQSLASNDRGSILVFLPGVMEITAVQDRFDIHTSGKSPLSCIVLPLYSELPASEQSRVFERAPEGFVKVVLSTNIAETGLTIPDVVYVIDSAKAREISYDSNRNLTCLKEIVVSQANCKQRKGRAGRTQPGVYYCLLTESAYLTLPEYRPPEILRLPLEDICLKARATLGKASRSGSLRDLFANALDPPPPKNVDKAISLLKQVQAMNPEEELSPLGTHLANLGIDVRLGKMLLYSVALCCLDPILTIAASLSLGKSPFVRPFGSLAEYSRSISKFKTDDSDLLMIYNAYAKWKEMKQRGDSRTRIQAYCTENYLNLNSFALIESAKNQLFRSLLDTGLIQSDSKSGRGVIPPQYNARSSCTPLVLCTLSACLFPNIIYMPPHKEASPVVMRVLGKSIYISLHPGSVLHGQMPTEPAWFAAHAIKARQFGENVTAMDLNRVSAIGMVSLIAGDVTMNVIRKSLALDDGNILIKAFPKSGIIVSLFSKLLHRAIDTHLALKSERGLLVSEANEIIELFVSVLNSKQA